MIETYADSGHAMLVRSDSSLIGDSVIDISHESLIEQWTRLKDWVTAEAGATSLYLSAAEDTVRNRSGAAARWRNLKLAEGLGFIEEGPWNEAWAERVGFSGAGFDEVKAFLEREAAAQCAEEEEKDSRHARELAAEQRAKKRWILLAAILGTLLGLSLAAAVSVNAHVKVDRDRAVSDKALLELRNSGVVLRQQINASDNVLTQNVSQQKDLRGKLRSNHRSGGN